MNKRELEELTEKFLRENDSYYTLNEKNKKRKEEYSYDTITQAKRKSRIEYAFSSLSNKDKLNCLNSGVEIGFN